MHINNQQINRWVQILEVVITVTWLLCFLDIRLPSPLPNLVKTLSYPVIGILVFLRWKRLSYAMAQDIPLLLYIGLSVASILWTGNPQKTMDSIRGLVRMYVFGAYFTARFSIKQQFQILAFVFGIAAIISFLVAIASPSYGIFDGAWVGIFSYKNYMGYTMNIGGIILLLLGFNSQKRAWLFWSLSALCITLSVLSRSAGSLVNIIMLLSLVPLYKFVKQSYKQRVVLIGASFILIGIVSVLIMGNLEAIVVDSLGKNLEFNGRTPIWNLIIEKGLEKPLLGYGLNSFWSSDAGTFVMIHTWSGFREEGFNSHNSFLELFLGLGFFGILTFSVSLFTILFRCIILLIRTKEIEFFAFLQLIIFMCLAGLADTNFLMSASSSLSCIFVSIALSTKVEMKRLKTSMYQK